MSCARHSLLRRRLWTSGAILMLCWIATRPALAQQTPRYDIVLQGAPLEEALREILTRTDINLAFDQSLVAGKRVYCAAEQLEVVDVLRCVLKGTGLDYFRLSSGLYVLTEQPRARPLYGSLLGVVVDSKTGAPLGRAHVLLSGTTGAVSNDAGRFIFPDLEPGAYVLAASFVGYRTRIDSVWVWPDTMTQARLQLSAEVLTTTPIIVDGLHWRAPSDTLGALVLSRQALLHEAYGAIPDISRSLGKLVGVRLSDATADLHIQSSGAGEHQFRLDGAPVFVPISIGGLVGPFSPFALNRVTVHRTGFGASVGSQTAGVIAAEHAFGEGAEAQLDPMSVNARAGVRIGGASLMVAGRAGLWDVFAPPSVDGMLKRWNRTDPFMYSAFRAIPNPDLDTSHYAPQDAVSGNPGLGFYDVHAAMRKRFGALRSLHTSGYWGRRRLESDPGSLEERSAAPSSLALDVIPNARNRYVWDSFTAQARYEVVLGPRALASLRGRTSHYFMQHQIITGDLSDQAAEGYADQFSSIDFNSSSGNRIQESAVEARLSVVASDRWSLDAGLEPTFTLSRFLVHGTRSHAIAQESGAWRIGSFVTNRISIGARLRADAGARFTWLAVRRAVYIEPRFALRYDAAGGIPWSARLATGLYRQYVTQFDVTSRSARALLSTSRMWLGLDASLAPPTAAHVSGELVLKPKADWTLRWEWYYKRHLHLLSVDYSASTSDVSFAAHNSEAFLSGALPIPTQWQSSFLAAGDGFAYGLGIHAEKKLSRLRLAASFEYSHTGRSFATLYDGATLTAPWNEPQRLEVSADFHPRDDFAIQARWHSILGRAWGFRQSYYDFLGAYAKQLKALAGDVDQPGDTEFGVLSIKSIVDHILAYRLEHPGEHRLPGLHQLDVSFAYTRRMGGASAQVRVDLLNALGLRNVADWRLASDPTKDLLAVEDRLLLPFTPSVAVRLAW